MVLSGILVIVRNPTLRFSNRVENYRKYRPGYPPEIIPLLKSECGLTSESLIADLGSGTGLFTKIFLRNGNTVFGVEPNAEMRKAGGQILNGYPKFKSVDGTAESTALPDHSVDFVVAGQAFHWFDRQKARPEFKRLLQPRGWVVLAWNGYRVESSQMMRAYQGLVANYGTDYSEVQREVVGVDVESFYAPGSCRCARFSFRQRFDYEGLEGRLLSSSYAPEPDHPSYKAMLRDLRALFAANQEDGKVNFDYETEVYYGRLEKS
ncbi:MAG TPA: class I SAM-dependent methyltransferase [Pyrinomonadaceae bacterium]|nr:class I SAM-dependent methyltransferase [Pyrinomonadaceae bacterium]